MLVCRTPADSHLLNPLLHNPTHGALTRHTGHLSWVCDPLHPQEAVHAASFDDVCITTAGRGQMARDAWATQPRDFSEACLHQRGGGLMK